MQTRVSPCVELFPRLAQLVDGSSNFFLELCRELSQSLRFLMLWSHTAQTLPPPKCAFESAPLKLAIRTKVPYSIGSLSHNQASEDAEPMKTKQLPLVILASLPALSLLFSACSGTVPGGQTTAVATSTTSTTVVDTFTATARVSAIDTATRTLTLALENGKQTTMKCGSQVANFKQIRVNDVVTVSDGGALDLPG